LATVSRLVRIFPFLRDEVKLGDRSVGLYSKAQHIVIYFHDVLGPRVPACNFINMNALTGCCDSYTLAVLRLLKVVSLSEELASQIDARHDFRAGSEAEVPERLRLALNRCADCASFRSLCACQFWSAFELCVMRKLQPAVMPSLLQIYAAFCGHRERGRKLGALWFCTRAAAAPFIENKGTPSTV
jgi:hypothetical protein